MSGTLCWDCKTKCCSWMDSLTPVPGWRARTTNHLNTGASYHVYECPLFTPDASEYSKASPRKLLKPSFRWVTKEKRTKEGGKKIITELDVKGQCPTCTHYTLPNVRYCDFCGQRIYVTEEERNNAKRNPETKRIDLTGRPADTELRGVDVPTGEND